MSGAVAAAVVASAAVTAYQNKREGDRQERAAQQQLAQQERLSREEDQARRKANQQEADIGGLLSGQSVEGLGNTTLTGGAGAPIDPNKLGRGNSLLGA